MLGTNTTLEVTEQRWIHPISATHQTWDLERDPKPQLSSVEKRFSEAIVRSEETKDESRHLSCEQGWEEDTTLWQEL